MLLTVSETYVEFSKEAASQRITITTGKEKWTAVCGAEWIKLHETEKALTISVPNNDETVVRKGRIMVFSAGVGQVINVVQNASKIMITDFPNNFEVNQWGGEHVLEIKSNTKKWIVDSDADWITLTTKPHKGEIIININENKNRQARETILTLTAGNISKKIIVKQQGILYYLLPCLKFDSDITTVAKFEIARHSKAFSPQDYVTVSPVFTRIFYNFNSNKLLEIKLYTLAEATLHRNFDQFMTEHQFELTSVRHDQKIKIFEQNKGDYYVEAIVRVDYNSQILFSKIPNQKKATPTFKEFPYAMNDFTANPEQIKAWESAHGGIIEEDQIDKRSLSFKVNNDSWFKRVYFFKFDDNSLKQINLMFTDISLAFYRINKEYYLTKELKKLLKKEGFSFFQRINNLMTGKIYFYDNIAKKRRLAIYVNHNKEGKATLILTLTPTADNMETYGMNMQNFISEITMQRKKKRE